MGLQICKSFSVVRVFELTETVNMTLRNSASLTFKLSPESNVEVYKTFFNKNSYVSILLQFKFKFKF